MGRPRSTTHAATKHSPITIRTNRHFLDWANQPMPFKVYEDLDPIELPRGLSPSSVPALDAIGGGIPAAERAPALADLAKLLYYSAGITKSYDHGGHKLYFRAAACTGALYHVDLYLVCGEIDGLEAGVYHFGAHDFALRRLRAGDYRETVAEASGRHPWTVDAPATLVFASTYWRNSWKYQSRAYRHVGWDSGTMLANLLAVAAASELRAGVVAGFTDGPIETLLGLDPQWEGAVALVPIGQGAGPTPTTPDTPPLDLKTAPLSRSMVDYPKIHELQAASSLVTPEEAAAWRGRPASAPRPSTGADAGRAEATSHAGERRGRAADHRGDHPAAWVAARLRPRVDRFRAAFRLPRFGGRASCRRLPRRGGQAGERDVRYRQRRRRAGVGRLPLPP